MRGVGERRREDRCTKSLPSSEFCAGGNLRSISTPMYEVTEIAQRKEIMTLCRLCVSVYERKTQLNLLKAFVLIVSL